MLRSFSKIIKQFLENLNILKPTQSQDKSTEDYLPSRLEIFKFYLRFLQIQWKNLILLNLSGIFICFILARQPFIILDLQTAIENSDESSIIWAVVEYIVYEFLYLPFDYYQTIINQTESELTEQSIQRQIMKHLLSLDLQYFQDKKGTQIAEIVTTGTQHISTQLHFDSFTENIRNCIIYISTLYFLYAQSRMLFLMLVTFGIVSAIANSYVTSLGQKIKKEQDEQEQYRNFALDDILINIHAIKSFGSEKKELKNMEKIITKNVVLKSKSQRYSSMETCILYSSFSILRILVIFKVIQSYISGTEDRNILLKTFGQIIIDIYNIQHSCNFIVKSFRGTEQFYYEDSKKGIGKVMKLFQQKSSLGEETQKRNSNGSREEGLLKGDISFEKVWFKYPVSMDRLAEFNQEQTSNQGEDKGRLQEDIDDSYSQDQQSCQLDIDYLGQSEENTKITKHEIKQRENVLINLSFEIKKGQCVAFVGMSGSGKSTIVNLIERFYDVSSGNILFDGKNVKDIPLTQLKRSIGLVQQEPSLFDNDIEYNITYGCLGDNAYSQEELKQICDVSGVSEFVFDEKRFPDGLKTLVGSKGMKLSGGQKQRIAIARALRKKPSILIFDEATSSLDAESEHIVQTYIDKLVEHRGITIIVIAHRLSTVINSDRIFVMKDGEIQEQGSHQELLEKDGVYTKLIHRQIQNIQGNININS